MSAVPLAPLPFLKFPADLQRLILGWTPLRTLAQLACQNKELLDVYLDRVKQRDAVVAGLVQSQFTPEFRERVSNTQTALPRDFIADPPVRPFTH
jgi:hypothetical protein